MNENLAAFTLDQQRTIVSALRERWHTAFFELVVARLLQEMGAMVTFEPAGSDGKRPDFLAEFEDSTVVVEATVPVCNGSIGDLLGRRTPLLDFIENHIPDGWSVGVSEVPDLGPADSKVEFKRVVRAMLDVAPPGNRDEELELCEDTAHGPIHLTLVSAERIASDRLLWEAGAGCMDDTETRIRRAVRRKRRQVRNADVPVLLAVQASGMGSDFEDFDGALFGHTYSRLGFNGEVLETGFRPDGVFGKSRSSRPTYAGVLAFLTVGFPVCRGPLLYPHPRSSRPLPSAIDALDTRHYDESTNSFVTFTGEGRNPVDGLRLVGA